MSSRFQFKSPTFGGASPPSASRVSLSSNGSVTNLTNGQQTADSLKGSLSTRAGGSRPGSAVGANRQPATAVQNTSARRRASPPRAASPPSKADEDVAAWQTEVDSIEQKQMQIQANQNNLLFSQIHILTRELGDLQKQFLTFNQETTQKMDMLKTDMETAQAEAHSALRLELAEHSNNADEMKAAWEEAHNALSQAMDDGLSSVAAEHAKALETHKAEQVQALAQHADLHGNSLAQLEELHNKRYEEHSATLQAGLEDVHGTLQKELADLRSGRAVDLKQVVTDVTTQLDKLTVDVEQMAKDIQAAQEEAHAALRLELAEHGSSAEEMRAAWEEAHKSLSAAMDENLSNLAADHAKTMQEHCDNLAAAKEEQAKLLIEHSDGHGANLTELEEKHNAAYEKHEESLASALESVHGKLQQELEDLRSGHAVNLRSVVEDLTQQVDKLTLDVESMAKDLAAAQEEAHASLRLELAEHGNNQDEMKAAWEEAHKALEKAMDDGLGNMAEEHAKLSENHSHSHAERLSEMEKQINEQFARLHSNHDALSNMHDEHRFEHAAALEKGMESVLENTHSRLQDELEELRSGHAANLSQIVEDVTLQVDTLTLAMENAQVLRKANSEKLEQIFQQMSQAFGSVSFSGKPGGGRRASRRASSTASLGSPAAALPEAAKDANAKAKTEPAAPASKATPADKKTGFTIPNFTKK